jgi:phage-related protein
MSGFGGSVKLTGESEYRKALKDITSNLKLVSSELKLTNTEFANGDKTVKQTKASYDGMGKALEEQKTKISALKQALAQAEKEYGSNNEKVKTFKTQLNNAEAQLKSMESQTDKSTNELKEMKEGFDDAGQGALTFSDVLKANILGDVIVGGLKKLGSAVLEVGKAFIDIGKQAVESYADYEQLVGGVETLFSKTTKTYKEFYDEGIAKGKTLNEINKEWFDNMEGANAVLENANNAYKSAGLSANEYMETVTSFSASLIQSLSGDTVKASEYAHRAIVDMSDNANKMGTDMSMIQNAYQGFAKANYTMLDNLKLGYGGTKTEMERLILDASKMKDVQKELGIEVDASSMSFGNIVNAISVMQTNMGIAGTTSREASETISGSINAMKGAWQNFLTGLSDAEAPMGELIDNLMESVQTVGKNLIPVIGTVIDSIVGVIGENFGSIVDMGLGLINQLIGSITTNTPYLVDTVGYVIKSIIDAFSTLVPQILPIAISLITEFANAIWQQIPTLLNLGFSLIDNISAGIQQSIPNLISKALDLINGFADFLTENVPILITKGIEMIRNLVKGLMDALPELISRVPEIISKFANVINDNAPTIIKGGFNIILDIIKGIINAIPTLIANIPKILTAFLDVWEAFNWLNLGKKAIEFIGNGIKGMLGFAKSSMKSITDGTVNMIKNLPQNLWNLGKNAISNLGNGISGMKTWAVNSIKTLGTNMLNGIKSIFSWDNIKTIGSNLIKGLWNGISDMSGWILNKIKGFGDSILGGIKSFFGIHSPSTVFRDEVGTNLALGLGEGFTNSMGSITKDMQNSIPTEFDTNATINGISSNVPSSSNNYANMVTAFKEALSKMKIELDDEVAGRFVENTVTDLLYT